MSEFVIKANDTSPGLSATLRDSDNDPIDLTNASVSFHMSPKDSDEVVVNSNASIVDAASGGVMYEWGTDETSDTGIYEAEFEVEYSDGSIETFPNDDYINVVIKEDIA